MPVPKEYVGVKFRVMASGIRWTKDGSKVHRQEVIRPTDDEGRYLDSAENPTLVAFKADDNFDVEYHLNVTQAIARLSEPAKAEPAKAASEG